MEDAGFRTSLAAYLRAHTTLPRAIKMLFTSISMAARAKWHEAPEHIKGVVARGWFLGRWIPTFLIIDGPIGRTAEIRDFRRCRCRKVTEAIADAPEGSEERGDDL